MVEARRPPGFRLSRREAAALAVDALARATLSSKSSILDVLAAGQEQEQNIRKNTANVAFIGPLISALLRCSVRTSRSF
ncbi:hypothetical protein [Parasphingorhabdus pacifica]